MLSIIYYRFRLSLILSSLVWDYYDIIYFCPRVVSFCRLCLVHLNSAAYEYAHRRIIIINHVVLMRWFIWVYIVLVVKRVALEPIMCIFVGIYHQNLFWLAMNSLSWITINRCANIVLHFSFLLLPMKSHIANISHIFVPVG